VQGIGRAKDGDSLMVGNTEVRLFGIDAPEFDQSCTRNGQSWSCGSAAADQLMRLVTGKDVRCTSMGLDQHGRTLGRCMVGTSDINRMMVAAGYAVAYRHYSNDYVSAEASAKAYKRGLWAGTFEMPDQYRHEGEATPVRKPERVVRTGRPPRVQSHSPQPSGGCVIKGNRGSHGWIYHVPGMPYYEKTQAEEIFCTEDQARAAGYRRARVR
jgi:hypothetical protein